MKKVIQINIYKLDDFYEDMCYVNKIYNYISYEKIIYFFVNISKVKQYKYGVLEMKDIIYDVNDTIDNGNKLDELYNLTKNVYDVLYDTIIIFELYTRKDKLEKINKL